MSWGPELRCLLLCATGVAFLIGLSVSASASGSSSRHITLTECQKRQLSAEPYLTAPFPITSTSSSSFDFWWPFPLASTSAAGPTPTASETDTANFRSSGDTPLLTSDVPSTSSSAALSPSMTAFSSTLLNATFSQGCTSTNSPLITITALPPLTSPFHDSHTFSTYHKPVNPILFVPLFGILGAGGGIVCGWFGYGCWLRSFKAPIGNCLVGPRYEGIKGDDGDEKSFNNAEMHGNNNVSGTVDEGDISMGSHSCRNHHDSSHRYEDAETRNLLAPKSNSIGPRVGLSALLHSPLLASFVNGYANCVPEPGVDINDRVTHLPLNTSTFVDEREEAYARGPQCPSAPTVFRSVPTSDEDDEDYESARRLANRRGTMRHKCIRRRLAEKLRLQFSPTRISGCKQSKKERKVRGRTPELEEGFLLQGHCDFLDSPAMPKKGPLRRNGSKPATGTRGHGRTNSDFSITAGGIQTPLRIYSLRDAGVGNESRSGILAYSTPLKSGTGPDPDDKYTPLSVNRAGSARKLVSARSTRRRIEIMDGSGGPLKFGGDADRRGLPTSPPLLNSPELKPDLFFSPGYGRYGPTRTCPEMARSATYERSEFYTPLRYERGSVTRGSPIRRGPTGPRQPNKLLSIHSPANGMESRSIRPQRIDEPLSNVAFRRGAARSSPCSPRDMKQERERLNMVPSSPIHILPKDRYEVQCLAFDKVDAIVERSWSARFMQGIPPPSSPTMFGAQTDRYYSNMDGRSCGEHVESSIVPGVDQAFSLP